VPGGWLLQDKIGKNANYGGSGKAENYQAEAKIKRPTMKYPAMGAGGKPHNKAGGSRSKIGQFDTRPGQPEVGCIKKEYGRRKPVENRAPPEKRNCNKDNTKGERDPPE